jgi:hypothetical protein
MILINGKFYKDNVEVPIEIGNIEQIALLKKIEKEKEDGINISVSISEITNYQLSFLWTCPICNYKNYEEYDFEDHDPNDEDIKDTIECLGTTCIKCQTAYTLEMIEDKYKNIYKLK